MLIKEIGKVVTGKTPPTENKEYYGGDYLFITPADLHNNFYIKDSEKHIAEAGINIIRSNSLSGLSVLVGCIGWDMGNVAIVEKKCATNQQINSITEFNEYANPYYVYYWLKGKKDYLLTIANVTRTPILSKSDFENIDIPLPEKRVQDLVANSLKKLDEKIDNNLDICTNLENIINLIYEHWFIRFEFPDENGNPYKSSGGNMVWSEELKRNIPNGWIVVNLMENDLCNIIDSGVEYFALKNYLPTGNIINESITDGEYVTYENRKNRTNMQPVPYSVWFAKMKDSVKHLSIPGDAEWFTEKYVLSTGFEGLRCSEKSFAYIHSIIYSSYFEQQKDKLAHGATLERVNNEDLKNIKFVVPSERELQLFANIVNPLLEMKFLLLHENQQLSAIRDFLLPLLMNGQVKIKS